jgi:hypothetical protein
MDLVVFPSSKDKNFKSELYKEYLFTDISYIDQTYLTCRENQIFIKKLFQATSDISQLLIFHTMGSGKTDCACIIINIFRLLGRRTLVLVRGDSSHSSFKENIKIWSKRHHIDIDISQYITFIHFQTFARMSTEDTITKYNNHLIIVDEAHNIRNTTDVQVTYSRIIKILKTFENIVLVFMTGTPMYDSESELEELMRLLHSSNLDYKQILNTMNLDQLCLNSVSYYKNTNLNIPDIKFATSEYTQEYINNNLLYYDAVVLKLQGQQKAVFDIIHQQYNRKSDFFDRKAQIFSLVGINDELFNAKETHQILFSNKAFTPDYRDKLKVIINNDELLKGYSAKIYYIYNQVKNKNQLSFIFCELVQGFGMHWIGQVLCYMLDYHIASVDYLYNKETKTLNPRGTIKPCILLLDNNALKKQKDLEILLKLFNSSQNSHGEYISIIIGSDVSAEALTFKNVAHVFIVFPHWNIKKIKQAMSRCIRINSHPDINDNIGVTIHQLIVVSDFETKDNLSVDLNKYRISRKKEEEITKKEKFLKECALETYDKKLINVKNISTTIFYYSKNHISYIKNELLNWINKKFTLEEFADSLHIDHSIMYIILQKFLKPHIFINDHNLTYNGYYYSLINHYQHIPFIKRIPKKISSYSEADYYIFKFFCLLQTDYARIIFIEKVTILVTCNIIRMVLENYSSMNQDIKEFFSMYYVIYDNKIYEISTIGLDMNARYAANKPISTPAHWSNHVYVLVDGYWEFVTDNNLSYKISSIIYERYMFRTKALNCKLDIIYISSGKLMLHNLDHTYESKFNSIQGVARGFCIDNMTIKNLNIYMFRTIIDSINTRYCNNIKQRKIPSLKNYLYIVGNSYKFYSNNIPLDKLHNFIYCKYLFIKYNNFAMLLYNFALKKDKQEFIRNVISSRAYVIRP